MKSKTLQSLQQQQQQPITPLICRICGDKARGLNFSVISCMSCKMFFRRHAQSSLSKQKCRFESKCTITRRTRKFCLPCRLQQCFQAGMDVQLIRHSHERKKPSQVPTPRPLSLLSKDYSTLSNDEWALLSNIVNSYDEHCLLTRTKEFLKTQSSLPVKLRNKDTNILNHVCSLFTGIHTFLGQCPLFTSLPIEVRQVLIKNNFNIVASFNAFFLARETNTFENECYSKFIDNIYGFEYCKSVVQASRKLEQNSLLVKVIFMVMAYLSNSTIVEFNGLENIQIIINPKVIIGVQDILVTMLWKYLIYQYGFREAILKYLSLIKSVLDVIRRMEKVIRVQKHMTLVGNIAEQTARTLSLEDGASYN